MSEWVTLDSLRYGALFEDQDGVQAIKSEYRYDDGSAPLCVLLASGEFAHFPNKGKELVREISIPSLLAAQREQDAAITESYRDEVGTAYIVCDIIAHAIRAAPATP